MIAKDASQASSFAKYHPARADQIEGWGNHWKVSDFSIGTVKIDQQSSPPRALVVSSEKVKVSRAVIDQPTASFLVFELKLVDDARFITDVGPWTIVEKAVDHFLNQDSDVQIPPSKLPPAQEAKAVTDAKLQEAFQALKSSIVTVTLRQPDEGLGDRAEPGCLNTKKGSD